MADASNPTTAINNPAAPPAAKQATPGGPSSATANGKAGETVKGNGVAGPEGGGGGPSNATAGAGTTKPATTTGSTAAPQQPAPTASTTPTTTTPASTTTTTPQPTPPPQQTPVPPRQNSGAGKRPTPNAGQAGSASPAPQNTTSANNQSPAGAPRRGSQGAPPGAAQNNASTTVGKASAGAGMNATVQKATPVQPDKTDVIIQKLLAVRNKQVGKQVMVLLKEDEIRHIHSKTREVLMQQPTLLELDGPIKVSGDIHGQYYDLLRLFDRGGFPPDANYLFLGDYVDRGKHSMEVICLLFCYKVKYPENFFLLRGNHESAAINRMYGFYDDCKRRYNVKLWKGFTDVFNCLPAAATIGEKILCMHGGISPELTDLTQIRDMSRPCEVPDQGLLCDLLWADPEFEIEGWIESDRGVSYLFGQNEVTRFLNMMDMDLIIRAHQVMERGYEFFADRQLVTLFSAPNYCAEFDNDAAIMNIDENLQCSFAIIPAILKGPRTFL
eukprot:TRINITY_DN3667_c0_g3_i1.p1 TRINITY_DN3667_c0_g3~~TRINITY_DN3667_c0_g3_i1.p1  ORF type:complete len:499 (+),score=127.94 TRINITY_DN3667_c0_g3_i1:90-1586(+)